MASLVEATNRDCPYTKERAPVCGYNNKTYANKCIAKCHLAPIKCKGECPCEDNDTCACPEVFAPVCGWNGKTYENPCMAQCHSAPIRCKGECPCKPEPCSCTFQYDPVCGSNNVTYSNSCFAKCAKVPIDCNGECPCEDDSSCACDKTLIPVCGRNHKTYANRCLANCHSAPIQCEGECPCQDDDACGCDKTYKPVCSWNHKTYTNRCLAKCHSAPIRCKGECPCGPRSTIEEGALLEIERVFFLSNKTRHSNVRSSSVPGLALASRSSIGDSEWYFQPGKEYVYEYSGRLLTGIPELADVYSGVGINCTVHIQRSHDSDTFSLSVKSPKYVRVNEKLESLSQREPSNWRQLRLPEVSEVSNLILFN